MMKIQNTGNKKNNPGALEREREKKKNRGQES